MSIIKELLIVYWPALLFLAMVFFLVGATKRGGIVNEGMFLVLACRNIIKKVFSRRDG